MPLRKKVEPVENQIESQEKITSKAKHPLVFISHDTRDADLAEEFSNLLKSASAGALKSFRSSDKKGTQGIEYGQEWYPAIMDKIDEASDVVCLLTQHSVDRPWILYEAGVAKGKLDKKVIGVAIGISLSAAIAGPFAQFQNNDGDADSVTKLVLELVRKVPGLDPDPVLVKQLVETFVSKAAQITAKYEDRAKKESKNKKEEESSVAKLFEEVKIMFDSLPARIEHRIDPELKGRSRRLNPMLVEEVIHTSYATEDSGIGFLILLSLFKDDTPWFFEVGMEIYRALKNSKNSQEREKLLKSFDNAMNVFNDRGMRGFSSRSKDTHFLLREAANTMQVFAEKMSIDKKSKAD